MRPTAEQLQAALSKSPIPTESGRNINIEDDCQYFRVARSFIAVAYWEAQQALHDVRKLIDELPTNPENINEIQMILEEKCDETLR